MSSGLTVWLYTSIDMSVHVTCSSHSFNVQKDQNVDLEPFSCYISRASYTLKLTTTTIILVLCAIFFIQLKENSPMCN